MLNGKKIVLLPRARLDFSDVSLSFLKLDKKEKHYFQSLLDSSTLEERLKAFYAPKNLILQAVTTTRIFSTSETESIYQRFNSNSNLSFDKIIFVSKNAGVLAKIILPDELFEAADLFSVGRSCQIFFAQQGLTTQSALEESSEGLLSLPDFSNIQANKILICKGAKGLTDLQEQCELRGAQVEVLDLYQREGLRQLLLPDIEHIAEIYAVSVFALKHLIEGLASKQAERITKIPLLAMSERIASEASLLGFDTINVHKI